MPRYLSVLAVAEAIALFGLLFAVADGSPLTAFGVIAAIVMLCVVALRLLGTETFSWLSERAALVLLGALNTAGVAVVLGVMLG